MEIDPHKFQVYLSKGILNEPGHRRYWLLHTSGGSSEVDAGRFRTLGSLDL